MSENSAIEWTDHTFNPWRGCEHATLARGAAHPGCEHCYAETLSKRNPAALGTWGAAGTRVMGTAAYWAQPFKWDREAQDAGERRRVFCASLADVFEDWQGPILNAKGQQLWIHPKDSPREYRVCESRVPLISDPHPDFRAATMDDLRRDLFKLIDATPWLDWLLLTKRPDNVRGMWPGKDRRPETVDRMGEGSDLQPPPSSLQPRSNVWLLTSVSNQATADAFIPELLKCRDLAPVLGISAEPLLAPVDLHNWVIPPCIIRDDPNHWPKYPRGQQIRYLDWVIVGGESGHHARPMHPQWARDIRDQCQAAGVPFFFKQWGEWRPSQWTPDNPTDWSVDDRHCVIWPDGMTGSGIIGDTLDAFAKGCRAMQRVGKKAAGRLLDGRLHDEYQQQTEASA